MDYVVVVPRHSALAHQQHALARAGAGQWHVIDFAGQHLGQLVAEIMGAVGNRHGSIKLLQFCQIDLDFVLRQATHVPRMRRLLAGLQSYFLWGGYPMAEVEFSVCNFGSRNIQATVEWLRSLWGCLYVHATFPDPGGWTGDSYRDFVARVPDSCR